MNSLVPDAMRRETKFVAPELEYHTLLPWLRLHPMGFIKAFPDRWVRNIYFDTHNYGAFNDNLVGISARTKVRYRWYGESRTPTAGVLEIKCRRNCFGHKLQYAIPKTPYKPGSGWITIRQSLLAQLPAEGRQWLQAHPFPVLINCYYRQYFISMDQRVRVTLDTKQVVWDQRFKPDLNLEHRANLPATVVVEVKVAREDYALARAMMEGLPIRVSRNSKYVTGVRAINGL